MGRKALGDNEKRTYKTNSTFPVHFIPCIDWLTNDIHITGSELFEYLIVEKIEKGSPFDVKIGFYKARIEDRQKEINQYNNYINMLEKNKSDYYAKLSQYAEIEHNNQKLPEGDRVDFKELRDGHIERLSDQYPFIPLKFLRKDLDRAFKRPASKADAERQLSRILDSSKPGPEK